MSCNSCKCNGTRRCIFSKRLRVLSRQNLFGATSGVIIALINTMLGAILSDQIPGGPSLTLTLTFNSNWEFSRITPDTDILPKIFPVYMI